MYFYMCLYMYFYMCLYMYFFPHPAPRYWYPVKFALEALQGHYTSSPEVSFATLDRRAFSQGVGPPPFSFKSKFISKIQTFLYNNI